MAAPSDHSPLPFPFFPSSSNINSRPRLVHSSDCSIRPHKNVIKIKKDWWGSTVNESTILSIEEEIEMDRRNKRRRTQSNDVKDGMRSSRSYGDNAPQLGRPASPKSRSKIDISLDSQESRRQSSPSSSFRRNSRDVFSPRPGAVDRSHLLDPPRSLDPSLPEIPLPASYNPYPSPSAPRRRIRPAPYVLDNSLGVIQDGVTFRDYEEYTTDQAIEPTRSVAVHRLQMEFFTSVSSPAKWSDQPGSRIFNPPSFPPITELEPDLDYIRKHFPLQKSQTVTTGSKRQQKRWEETKRVLEWLYGGRVSLKEVYFFGETVPHPLLAILKMHASLRMYARGVSSVGIQLGEYLDKSPSSRLTSVELRARELLDWLRNGVAQGKRSERWSNWWIDEVQRERDGNTAKGDLWLKETDGMRTIRDLERWERDVKAAKQ